MDKLEVHSAVWVVITRDSSMGSEPCAHSSSSELFDPSVFLSFFFFIVCSEVAVQAGLRLTM